MDGAGPATARLPDIVAPTRPRLEQDGTVINRLVYSAEMPFHCVCDLIGFGLDETRNLRQNLGDRRCSCRVP